jgi:hypothetical protein
MAGQFTRKEFLAGGLAGAHAATLARSTSSVASLERLDNSSFQWNNHRLPSPPVSGSVGLWTIRKEQECL